MHTETAKQSSRFRHLCSVANIISGKSEKIITPLAGCLSLLGYLIKLEISFVIFTVNVDCE